MFEFLFDIKPDAGNVCPTTRLAYLISERGNKVYYTDTSDSVFTTGLLRKGIGRIIYPHDFRWFTPHLALLDYQLQDKQQVYNEYDINYLFIAINKTDRKIDLMPEMPVVTLPPIPYKLLPQGAKDDDFIDKLTEIKEDRSRTVIIGLLEDEEEERKVNTPSHTESFYKAIKQSASIHPQYQFILLTNHGEVETRLFSLPPNIAIYRLPRLQALLPLCDMALITGGITHWTECTFAHVPMAEFTPQEIKKITPVKLDRQIIDLLVDLTIEFYRRNYIEGLFLSSGVVRNPDYTMERLVRVAKDLRLVHKFNGYIHLKSIPGASRELVNEAGLYADRLSVNIEIPKEENLKLLAPEKDHKSVYQPMRYIQQGVLTNKEDRKKFRHVPRFVPAGQSTQMIVGATTESDKDILYLSSSLYQHPTMRRVYYSGYISVNTYDKRLPALKQPPLVRENRLYQADWLLRFYQFKVEEIVDDSYPDLDLEIDPKLGWALRHPELFPIDINQADYEMILRVPGIGIKSARQIIASRRFSKLGFYELKKIGVVMKKAQYFITCNELPTRTVNELTPTGVRRLLVPKPKKKVDERQLILNFTDNE